MIYLSDIISSNRQRIRILAPPAIRDDEFIDDTVDSVKIDIFVQFAPDCLRGYPLHHQFITRGFMSDGKKFKTGTKILLNILHINFQNRN
jgi:hypothetical protein